MKRFLLVAGLFVTFVLIALAVFLATFDVDRYRPLVISQLEAATGSSVHLERLSLGWHGGLALDVQGLAVAPDPATSEPSVAVDHASIVIRLFPLLRKQIQVASIALVHPRVHVRRRADGSVGVVGLAVGPATDGTPSAAGRVPPRSPAGGSSAAIMGLLVSSLEVTDGTVRLTDEAAQPSLEVTLRDVDAAIKDISLAGPIQVQASMALFSDRPDLTIHGRLYPPRDGQAARIERLRLEADLSRVDVEALARALPAVERLGLRERLAGALQVSVDRLTLDPEGLAGLTAQAHLSQGRLALSALASAFENLNVDLIAQPGRVELKRGSFTVAGGTVAITALTDHLATAADLTFQINIDAVRLEALLPASATEPHLQGRLAASFHGTCQGLTPTDAAHTLSGEGTLRLSEVKILNLNLLRAALERLSVLPGLMERLEARLPKSSKAKLAEHDTVLQPIEVPVTADRGILHFTHLRLATDLCELEGAAAMELDGTLTGPLTLRIEPELSAAMIGSVKELQNLTDAKGRVEFPVMLQGKLPRVVPIPDVQYVASRLVVMKAEELLGNFLQKALEKQSGAPSGP